MENINIQHQIKNYLSTHGIRQSFIAEETGISEALLSRKLNGKVAMSISELVGIANLLNTTPDDLLGIRKS